MTRIQIISPHPDDVELFCGGTLLKHLDAGDQVQTVMMSKGGKGVLFGLISENDLVNIRVQELNERMGMISEVSLIHMNFPDGSIKIDDESYSKVLEAVKEWNPEIVYLPEVDFSITYRSHPDHNASAVLGHRAAVKQNCELRYYHSKEPNFFVDVTSFVKENRKALKCYRSQNSWKTDSPYLLFRLGLARDLRLYYYGWKTGCWCAEAFRRVAPTVT